MDLVSSYYIKSPEIQALQLSASSITPNGLEKKLVIMFNKCPHGQSVKLFIYGYSVRKVACSRLGRGTIVGGVFHPARQLTRFSPPNMPYLNFKFIYNQSSWEAIHYRPYASPSFKVPATIKTATSGNIIIMIIINKSQQ